MPSSTDQPDSDTDQLPLVTIVTPSFNQADTLRQTIESVLSQDYPNIQYIVMDGGSTDATCDILRQYEGRLEWISEKDNGQSDAIHKGFCKAKGQIIAWLNSDDIYTPGAIRTAVKSLQTHPHVDLVYGDVDWITRNGKFIAHCVSTEQFNRHRLLHYSNFICQPTTFFRRNAYEAIGGLNADLHFVMDYDLWLKLTAHKPAVYIQQRLAQVRCYEETKTSQGGTKRMVEMQDMIRSHQGNGLPAFYRLEYAGILLADAMQHLMKLRLLPFFSCIFQIVKNVFSPRVLCTVFSKQFRDIMVVRMQRTSTH